MLQDIESGLSHYGQHTIYEVHQQGQGIPFCNVLAYMMLELAWVNLASLTPYFLLSKLL